jgi:hypothetical protein
MKYALINPKGRILRTSEVEFEFTPEGKEVVELTDEQAEQVKASSKRLFFVEGILLTRKAKRWSEDPESVKASLRPKRNRLLSESDWTQLNDSPFSEDKLAAWVDYRQNLRDLTDNIDENGKVTFPTTP